MFKQFNLGCMGKKKMRTKSPNGGKERKLGEKSNLQKNTAKHLSDFHVLQIGPRKNLNAEEK